MKKRCALVVHRTNRFYQVCFVAIAQWAGQCEIGFGCVTPTSDRHDMVDLKHRADNTLGSLAICALMAKGRGNPTALHL